MPHGSTCFQFSVLFISFSVLRALSRSNSAQSSSLFPRLQFRDSRVHLFVFFCFIARRHNGANEVKQKVEGIWEKMTRERYGPPFRRSNRWRCPYHQQRKTSPFCCVGFFNRFLKLIRHTCPSKKSTTATISTQLWIRGIHPNTTSLVNWIVFLRWPLDCVMSEISQRHSMRNRSIRSKTADDGRLASETPLLSTPRSGDRAHSASPGVSPGAPIHLRCDTSSILNEPLTSIAPAFDRKKECRLIIYVMHDFRSDFHRFF